ncbi:MAG: hypothetical protein IJN43_10670 [Ruminococcus sp.]|nr:hypothetical protein [Ruminococcus sp.]
MKVYNFEIEDFHTYFVGDMMVECVILIRVVIYKQNIKGCVFNGKKQNCNF